MKSHTISEITYQIIVVEEGTTSIKTYTFERLFFNKIKSGDDWEFVYAINELAAEPVMKLNVNESMYFQSNRDNEQSKGIIVRIK